MTRLDALLKTVAFLREIGINVDQRDNADGFAKHIAIENGGLLYNDQATSANLLHEAGHLAVLPSRVRSQTGDNLDKSFLMVGNLLDTTFDYNNPDSPRMRALLQCGETEATAWAWAAGKAIGLPDKMIITDDDYDHGGANMRLGLTCNCYLGINGLVAGGMAANVKSYPALTRWLQI